MEKRCARCKQTKPIEDFHVKSRKTGARWSYCKVCASARHREYYAARPDYYKAKNRQLAERLKKLVDALKDRPCTDCRQQFPPCAMDWDHLDPRIKIESVSTLRKFGSEKRVLEEIAKCELVCAVCHRLRTQRRMEVVA